MQQVEMFQAGERNYYKIRGDTGPLVYVRSHFSSQEEKIVETLRLTPLPPHILKGIQQGFSMPFLAFAIFVETLARIFKWYRMHFFTCTT